MSPVVVIDADAEKIHRNSLSKIAVSNRNMVETIFALGICKGGGDGISIFVGKSDKKT